MANRDTVVVAMSGGVDSSVAAALLQQQGYEVIGLMLRLWAECGPQANRCCAPDAVSAARQVAGQLGIPFYVRDYRDAFKHAVVDYFVSTYASGRTPNPCVMCNEHIRFGPLLAEALALGARYLATGHYVRLRRTEQGEFQLLKGADPAKDQSYVLHRLVQAQLSHTLFPLGTYLKKDVRQVAAQMGLHVSDRPDSQDLCFVGDGNYRAFMARYLPAGIRPGPLVDTAGHRVGTHSGLAFYTIGQRKGLGIAPSHPMYVVRLDAESNVVVVGSADELGCDELVASQVSYTAAHAPASPAQVTARIRYRAPDVTAVLTDLSPQRIHLKFGRPLRGITPGQAAVCYDGEVLLGGGFIE
jgi:tRNA-specific 2-thiouridylase